MTDLKNTGPNREVAMLRSMAEDQGLPSVASMVRAIIREYNEPEGLFKAFSSAFGGSEVGAMGKDIIVPLLGHELPHVRQEAIEGLGRWCEDDEDGEWQALLLRHLDREQDPALSKLCQEILDRYDSFPEPDCPECDEGVVMADGDDEYCTVCGTTWEYELDEEEEYEFCSTIARAGELKNSLDAAVRLTEIPNLLQRVLDIPPELTLGCIESIKIGHVSTRETSLKLTLKENGVLEGESESFRFHLIAPDEDFDDDLWNVEIEWD